MEEEPPKTPFTSTCQTPGQGQNVCQILLPRHVLFSMSSKFDRKKSAFRKAVNVDSIYRFMGGFRGGGGRGSGPPYGPLFRLFNIGPKIGPPLGPPFFACTVVDLRWTPPLLKNPGSAPVDSTEVVGKYFSVTLVLYVPSGLINKQDQQPVSEDDLVIIRPGSEADRNKQDKWVMGLVSKVTKSQPRNRFDLHEKLGMYQISK